MQRGKFEAFELNDDDLRGPTFSSRHQSPRQRLQTHIVGSESQSVGKRGSLVTEVAPEAAAAEQCDALEADARSSLAVAEALQAAYGPSQTQ